MINRIAKTITQVNTNKRFSNKRDIRTTHTIYAKLYNSNNPIDIIYARLYNNICKEVSVVIRMMNKVMRMESASIKIGSILEKHISDECLSYYEMGKNLKELVLESTSEAEINMISRTLMALTNYSLEDIINEAGKNYT